MDDPELLTVSQAAEALNATSQTIRNWIRGGRLRGVRIGNRFLIAPDEVARLRGDEATVRTGEGPWDYDPAKPAAPLPRKAREAVPAADPADGLLGA